MVLADIKWLLLWFCTISAVTHGASIGWMQGSVVTPALLADRDQVGHEHLVLLALL